MIDESITFRHIRPNIDHRKTDHELCACAGIGKISKTNMTYAIEVTYSITVQCQELLNKHSWYLKHVLFVLCCTI